MKSVYLHGYHRFSAIWEPQPRTASGQKTWLTGQSTMYSPQKPERRHRQKKFCCPKDDTREAEKHLRPSRCCETSIHRPSFQWTEKGRSKVDWNGQDTASTASVPTWKRESSGQPIQTSWRNTAWRCQLQCRGRKGKGHRQTSKKRRPGNVLGWQIRVSSWKIL